VERVLVSVYPQPYPPAQECATKLIVAALAGEVEVDWNKVKRLAEISAYQNWKAVKDLINEQAEYLKVRSPCDSDE
jgi:hypothetical protein